MKSWRSGGANQIDDSRRPFARPFEPQKRLNGSHDTSKPSPRSNSNQNVNYLRLCLKQVPQAFTKPQIKALIEDFEDVSICMPLNTFNKYSDSKLVFIDFQRTWEAKVAMKLINMTRLRGITAKFADDNENQLNSKEKPALIHRSVSFQEDSIPEFDTCAYCKNAEASFVCETCFSLSKATFYCNPDHQSRDWMCHKFDCKPLPNLVKPAEAAAAIIDKNELKTKVKYVVPYVDCFKAGDKVKVMSVCSERVLYVRPIKENFQKLLDTIEEHAKNAANHTKLPDINDIALGFYRGRFCRAQIVDTFETDSNGNDVLCFLIDFGVHQKFAWNSLKKLGYKFRSIPRHTFKVILSDVKICNMTHEIEKYLSDINKNNENLIVLKVDLRGSDRYVEVKRERETQTINEVVRKMSKLVLELSTERILFDESKIHKISTGENVSIRVTDVEHLANGYISCMSADKFPLSWKKDKEINEYGDRKAPDEVYTPIINELCLVKNNDRWERAAVVEIKTDEISMMLVDKYAIVSILRNNVRKLPIAFTTDFFAQLCVVEGINEENLTTAEEIIIPRSNILASLVSCDDDEKPLKLSFDFLGK